MNYSFVFVCQQGPLEIKSMLLAASLRRYAQRDCELVAAIPVPEVRWGKPAERTLSFLRRLGVRLVPIKNDISLDYPIGNKVSCLGVQTDADVRIFLDSDILCVQPFTGAGELEAPFCAVPADLDSFGATEATWALIYGSQQLSLPTERVRATVSGELMLPYFNAGCIAVHSRLELCSAWCRICREIDADPRIPNKRPWLDQIALPVAVKSLGIEYRALDHRYNYPAHLKQISPQQLPYFAHYHTQKILASSPTLRSLVCELAMEHAELKRSIIADRKWRGLLRWSARGAPARGAEWLNNKASNLHRVMRLRMNDVQPKTIPNDRKQLDDDSSCPPGL